MIARDLAGLSARVFGASFGVGVVKVGSADPATLFPDEARAIRNAVAPRRAEFSAGRAAARIALKSMQAIPMGPDRAPVWPTGWSGSISHAGGWAVAVARKTQSHIGLDLERAEALPADLLPIILTPAEVERYGNDLLVGRVVFAVKEAVYKAQYPRTRQVLDFDAFDIRLEANRFTARFCHTVGVFTEGEALRGRWASGAGWIMAGVLA